MIKCKQIHISFSLCIYVFIDNKLYPFVMYVHVHVYICTYYNLQVNSLGLHSSCPRIIATGYTANTVINATLR